MAKGRKMAGVNNEHERARLKHGRRNEFERAYAKTRTRLLQIKRQAAKHGKPQA